MAIFEVLGGKIKNAGQSVAQSTKNFADVTKLKSSIIDYKKQITEMYTVLGKSYYELRKNNPDPGIKEIVVKINSLFKQIDDLKQQINEIEGLIKCPNCGCDIPYEAVFCNNCGCKIPKEEKGFIKCPNCGGNVPHDALFCNSCGCKIPKELKGKVCSNCGNPLPENSMFCAHCGTKVEQEETEIPVTGAEDISKKLCPSCRKELTEEDVFCPECGTPVNQKPETEDSSVETSSAKQEGV